MPIEVEDKIFLCSDPTEASEPATKRYADVLGVFPCGATLVNNELALAVVPPAVLPDGASGIIEVTFVSPGVFAAGTQLRLGEMIFLPYGTDGEILADGAWGDNVAVRLSLDTASGRAFFTRSGAGYGGGDLAFKTFEIVTDGVSATYDVEHNFRTTEIAAWLFRADTGERVEWVWSVKNENVVRFEADVTYPAGMVLQARILAGCGGGAVERVTIAQLQALLDAKADAEEMATRLQNKADANHNHAGMLTDSALLLALQGLATEAEITAAVEAINNSLVAMEEAVAKKADATALAGKVDSNDSRLSNARTPTAHAASHASGGMDAVTPSAIGAATAGAAFVDCTATYAGGVFTLTPKGALPSPLPEITALRFTSPVAYSVGDSVKLNSTTYPIQPVGTTALAAGAFVAGSPVDLALKGGGCFFKQGGGGECGGNGGRGGGDSGWLIWTGDNPPPAGAVGLNLPNAVTSSRIVIDAEAYIATGKNYGTSWENGHSMTKQRAYLASALRPDNAILALGGYGLNTTESSADGTSSFVAGPTMTAQRTYPAASLRGDNAVMVLGGSNSPTTTESSADGTSSFVAGPTMTANRGYLAGSLRADGAVMAIGGGSGNPINTTESSAKGTSSFVAGPAMTAQRFKLAATRRIDNAILALGGIGSGWTYLNSTESSANGINSFVAGLVMTTQRESLAACLRADNAVMALAGASSASQKLNSTESSADGTGSFVIRSTMTTQRAGLAAAIRVDNAVMALGGTNSTGDLATTESSKTLPADSIYPESTLVIKPTGTSNRCKIYESGDDYEYQYIGTVYQTQGGKDIEQSFTILN